MQIWAFSLWAALSGLFCFGFFCPGLVPRLARDWRPGLMKAAPSALKIGMEFLWDTVEVFSFWSARGLPPLWLRRLADGWRLV